MEIGAKRAELAGFLDSRGVNVNAPRCQFVILKQWHINMVLYYLEKH